MQNEWKNKYFLLCFVLFFSVAFLAIDVCGQSQEKAQIVYVSGVVETREIFVMDADGANRHRLTDNSFADASPAWSPDGEKIAFTSQRDGNWEIYVMDADGTNQRNLTNSDAQDSCPSWSPDGKWIAFSSNCKIFIMDANGENLRNISNGLACDQCPSWSPDGNRIVFLSGQEIAFGASQDESALDVYVMDSDGNNIRKLTSDPAFDDNPTWSSDGKKIAFESNRDSPYQIYIMDTNGENVIRLDNGYTWERDPDWFDPEIVSLVSTSGKLKATWAWIKKLQIK